MWLRRERQGMHTEFQRGNLLGGSNTDETRSMKAKAIPVHAMQALRGRGSTAPTALHGWVVSVTSRPRFTPGETTLGTHWIGGWVGLRDGWTQRLEEKSFPSIGNRTPVDQSVVINYIDWATTGIVAWNRFHKIRTYNLTKNSILLKLKSHTVTWNDCCAAIVKRNWF
jgi:hypothetical protein